MHQNICRQKFIFPRQGKSVLVYRAGEVISDPEALDYARRFNYVVEEGQPVADKTKKAALADDVEKPASLTDETVLKASEDDAAGEIIS